MKTIPTVELSVSVPSEIVAKFLRERPKDSRIVSASQLLQRNSGESTHKVQSMDDFTIKETMMHNGWFGQTQVAYCYSLSQIDDSRTRVVIRTTYELPWILRSVFSWPMGHIVADVIASYAATTTVSDLVALERGYQSRSLTYVSAI
jgi:NADPH-dependent curcumin reductase CurA